MDTPVLKMRDFSDDTTQYISADQVGYHACFKHTKARIKMEFPPLAARTFRVGGAKLLISAKLTMKSREGNVKGA